MEEHHPEIEANLLFRDALRADPVLKQAYADLKEKLLQDDSSHHVSEFRFPYYTLRKGSFIRHLLKEKGFNRLRILKCTDESEWAAARHLRNHFFFKPQGLEDPYIWTFTHPQHAHLVLYEGCDIIGYAHFDFSSSAQAILRMIAILENHQKLQKGAYFLKECERWLKHHGFHQVYTESRPDTLGFYEKNGYTQKEEAGPSLAKDIPLLKNL
jgi:GNAT superfamily N-acetyltransferase